MIAYKPEYSKNNEAARRKHSHRVTVDFEKGYYSEILKPAADRAGLPGNTFIKKAVQEKIDRMRE